MTFLATFIATYLWSAFWAWLLCRSLLGRITLAMFRLGLIAGAAILVWMFVTSYRMTALPAILSEIITETPLVVYAIVLGLIAGNLFPRHTREHAA